MSGHTPEPWSVGRTTADNNVDRRLGKWWRVPIHVGDCTTGRGNIFAECSLGGPGAASHEREDAEANAARIVACVNALAGLNPSAIPALVAFVRELASSEMHDWYQVRARAIVAEMEKPAAPGRTREDAE